MLDCFTKDNKLNIPIVIIEKKEYPSWLKKQNSFTKKWLSSTQFEAEHGRNCLIPNESGSLQQIICCLVDIKDFWCIGQLPLLLPTGNYKIVNSSEFKNYAIGWGLGSYQFSLYKKVKRSPAKLFLPKDFHDVSSIVESIYLVRNLINTPTEDMGPTELGKAAVALGKKYKAQIKQIVGSDLLKNNFAVIHAVGRASDDAPRLIDLRWGKTHHPKVTLVGKGVCFDSGGLDIKGSQYMLLMKKDMGGAAHVLGLASMIMAHKLPIRLRVLIPAVENVISGNAFKPGDVIKSKKGITIEIGNTDAEGRLVLADAITEAVKDKPDMLIDIATLTGAARVALGTDLPAMFTNQDKLAEALVKEGEKQRDLMWRLPLYAPYRESLNSPIADINNDAGDSYGGAIVAALFIKEFVPENIPWVHFDLMAWNLRSRPGRPQGGEALALRALFGYLKNKYGG